MIISRIIPVESAVYKSLSIQSEKLDGFMKWKPVYWFAVWIMITSGTGAGQGAINRYSYWDMSQAGVGLLTLVIITLFITYFIKNEKFSFEQIDLKPASLLIHVFVALVLFMTGWGMLNGDLLNALKYFLPYLLAYLSLLLMVQINLEDIPEKGYQPGKGYIFISLIMALAGSAIGVLMNDPVISTASAVYAPFLLVAFVFPEHKRHIQRIRIYPIFIYAMFVSVRSPWLLIPLSILFFGLRTYNYFRYKIVYPTFSVDHD